MTSLHMESTEDELVAQAAAGSRESFDRLASAIDPGLRAAARKLAGQDADADELVQETLTAAFRGLKSLRSPSAWRGWIYQILVRRNYDRLLKRRFPASPEPPRLVSDPLTGLLHAEAKETALQTLDTLSPPLREILSLRFLHDLSLKEIAARTGRPLGTVKFMLWQGLQVFEEAFRGRLP